MSDHFQKLNKILFGSAHILPGVVSPLFMYRGADKSLAWQGRKQTTFPAFYWTWRFITTLTTVHHLSLPQPNQSIPLTITLLTGAACFLPGRAKDLSAPRVVVFALLPMHLSTLLTGKFRRIWNFLPLPTTSQLWEIRLKVSWCGEPLSYAAWQVSTLTERWLGSPKVRRSRWTPYPGHLNFWTTLTDCFPFFA